MSGGPWEWSCGRFPEKTSWEVFHRFPPKKTRGGWVGGGGVLGDLSMSWKGCFFFGMRFLVEWFESILPSEVEKTFVYCGWNDELLPKAKYLDGSIRFTPWYSVPIFFEVFQPMWKIFNRSRGASRLDRCRPDIWCWGLPGFGMVAVVLLFLGCPSDTTGATWIQLDTNREQRETSTVTGRGPYPRETMKPIFNLVYEVHFCLVLGHA